MLRAAGLEASARPAPARHPRFRASVPTSPRARPLAPTGPQPPVFLTIRPLPPSPRLFRHQLQVQVSTHSAGPGGATLAALLAERDPLPGA
ncbi:MAG: hypothetical protein ACK5X3_24560, partial [Pseudomonadota bacterium]